MASNPYTLPARYEYKSLPLDFMLQAGLAQEARRAKTEADLYDLQQKSIIPHGYSTELVAKRFQEQFEPKIAELASRAESGEINPSEAAREVNRLRMEMQKNPLFLEAQKDFGLNELAARQAVNPAIKQEAAQKFFNPQTGQFNQLDPDKVLRGETRITPEYYSMLERPDFKASYDPIMDLNSVVPPKVTGGQGKPYTIQLPTGIDPVTGEQQYTTQIVDTEEQVKEITGPYFRDQISGFVTSNQYLNNPYNDYFREKFGRDMTQDEMYSLAEAHYSPGFFSNKTTDRNYKNAGKQGSDSVAGKGKDVQGLFDNVATTNLNFGKVNPLSEVKTYNDLVNVANPKEGVLDFVMAQHGAIADGSDENGMIYKNAKTGLPLTEAESVALEADLYKQTNKINGAQNIMAQLQPEIDKIKGSMSQNEFDLINIYNKIDKTPVFGVTSGPTSAIGHDRNEWENLQMEVDAIRRSGESITKQADGNYYKVGGNGNLQLPKDIGEKLYTVQSWETRGPALEKQAKLIDKKLNDLVAKNVASFDVAGKAFLFNDDPSSKDLYNPTHKKIAQDINSAIGTFPDEEIKRPEFWGKSGEGVFGKLGAQFNPKMFFPKDGHWMARGNFETTVDGNKKMSKDLDITIDEIIKKDLPTNGDFQLQVYSEIDDQMNYILPGHEGKVTIFGKSRGKQDDVTMKVYKSATGESVRIESDNALFTLGDIDPETGEFKYRPHYVKSQEFNNKAEATLDVVKSQATLQEYKSQYPYAFDSNGNYIGDVKYGDSRQNKEAVEKSGKVLKEQLGWDDDVFNGFMKAVEFESGFSPDSVNTNSTANATGLIQFFPDNPSAPYSERYKTINGNKYMLEDIKNMSVHEQMSGPILDYFAENGTNIQNPEDVYLAVFYPAILNNSKFINKSRQAKLDTKLLEVIPNLNQVKNSNPSFSEAETVGDLLKIVGIIE